jgi:DNA-binding NarL/FixJ family response regulator
MSLETGRILLTVEHGVVQQALTGLLQAAGFEVIDGEADRELAEVARGRRPSPSIAVLDAANRHFPALALGSECNRLPVPLPWMMLAESTGDPDVLTALKAGARGFVVKTESGAEMIAAIRSVLRGGLYLSPETCSALIPRLVAEVKDCPTCTTARDRDLLKAIAEGKSTGHAAAILGLAANEVRRLRRQLKTKLGIRNVAGLVRYAIRHRIVAP